MKKSEIGSFSGPLILATHVYYAVRDMQLLCVLPVDIFHLRDITPYYTPSACIYGDGSHFVSIVRDFSTDRLFFCDGMTNNAQFVEYKASAGKFPITISRKRLVIKAYLVRSEYAINTSNRY